MVYHVCCTLNIYYHFVYKEYLMQESYSIGLILLIYITIKYNNVVFELLVRLVCGPGSKFKTMETSSCHNLWKPVLAIIYD